jgi:hypothetical protein
MLLFLWRTSAATLPPAYSIGDQATSDVATPVRLVVLDREETEQLRSLSARRVPCFVKYFPALATVTETNFHQAFTANRERFAEALQKKYKKPALDTQDLAQPAFSKWVAAQQRELRPFPLTPKLAEIWAAGALGETLEAELAARLRDAMSHYMRVEPATLEAHVGPPQWRVITTESRETPDGLDFIFRQTNVINRTNLIVFSKAKKSFTSSFPPDEQPYAKYLVTFLRENCIVDGELTRQARWERTNALWSADNYEAGQVVVRAGQTVDARIKAALDELRTKLQPPVGVDRTAAGLLDGSFWVWEWALTFAVLIVAAAVWAFRGRQTASTAMIRVRRDSIAIAGSEADLAPARFWRERAFAAERRVVRLTQAIRIRLAPHLARWLAHKLVQQLVSNRKQLLAVQRQAEAEIELLEQRLQQMQAPFQERIRAYETRINELEKELSLKDHQNRELIRMTIASARRKLELEHAKSGSRWN